MIRVRIIATLFLLLPFIYIAGWAMTHTPANAHPADDHTIVNCDGSYHDACWEPGNALRVDCDSGPVYCDDEGA